VETVLLGGRLPPNAGVYVVVEIGLEVVLLELGQFPEIV
jgi:hypothetical protein